METHSGRFANFCVGRSRSEGEWAKDLGPTLTEALRLIGVFSPVTGRMLDGFEGEFDFGKGQQIYRLFWEENRAIAHPLAGGRAVDASGAHVYTAAPEMLFRAIADASGFELLSWVHGQSDQVAVLSRKLDDKLVKALVVLDESWFDQFAVSEWVERLAKDADLFFLITDCPRPFPWSFRKKIHTRVLPLPMVAESWAISRTVYCDSSLGISARTIASICSDKKVVFDGINKEIFVLGHEIKVKPGSRPYDYIRGILLIGSSPVAEDAFAQDFFGIHQELDNEVRGARTQARRALKIAFKNSAELLAEALELLMPSRCPDLKVCSGLRPDQILMVGVD